MTFASINGVITQTGTDTSLAGLAGLTGVTVMSNLTGGITKRIVNIGANQLVIAGTLNQNTATDTLVLDSAAVPTDGTGGRIRVINGGKWTAYSTASRNGIEFYRKSPALISNQYQDHYLALLVNAESGAAIDWKNVTLTAHSASYLFANGSKIDIDNTDLINISASGNSGQVRMASCDARINNLRLNCMAYVQMSRDKNNVISNILPSGAQYGLDFSGNSSSAANDTGFYRINNYSHDPSNDYAYRFWGQYARVYNCAQGSDIEANTAVLDHRGLVLFYRQLRADAYLNGTAVNDGTVYAEDYNNGSRPNFTGIGFTSGLEGGNQDFRGDRDFFGTTGITGEVLLAVRGKLYGAANPIITDYRTKNGNSTDINDVHILKYECDYDTVSSQSFKGTGELVLTRFLKADANVSLAKADALAVLGTKISVDPATDTVTVLQSITLNNLYDACKAYKTSADKAKIKYKGIGTLLFTASGGTLNTTLNIVVNAGAVISAGSKFDTLITTGTVSGGGTVSVVYSDVNRNSAVTVTGLPDGAVITVRNEADTTTLASGTVPYTYGYNSGAGYVWIKASYSESATEKQSAVKYQLASGTANEIGMTVGALETIDAGAFAGRLKTAVEGSAVLAREATLAAVKTGVDTVKTDTDKVSATVGADGKFTADALSNAPVSTGGTGGGLSADEAALLASLYNAVVSFRFDLTADLLPGTGTIVLPAVPVFPEGYFTGHYLVINDGTGRPVQRVIQNHAGGVLTLSAPVPALYASGTQVMILMRTAAQDGGSGGATPAEIWAHPERTLTVPAGLSPQQEAVLAEIRTNTKNTADAVAGEGVNVILDSGDLSAIADRNTSNAPSMGNISK